VSSPLVLLLQLMDGGDTEQEIARQPVKLPQQQDRELSGRRQLEYPPESVPVLGRLAPEMPASEMMWTSS